MDILDPKHEALVEHLFEDSASLRDEGVGCDTIPSAWAGVTSSRPGTSFGFGALSYYWKTGIPAGPRLVEKIP